LWNKRWCSLSVEEYIGGSRKENFRHEKVVDRRLYEPSDIELRSKYVGADLPMSHSELHRKTTARGGMKRP
jgi:hypothetical protein